MSAPPSGLRAWVVQQASAFFMLLFLFFMLGAFLFFPPRSYVEWRSWVGHPGMSIALLAFFAALLAHMWVGLRDVLLDYARPPGLRGLLLGLLASGLVGMAVWLVWILMRAQT